MFYALRLLTKTTHFISLNKRAIFQRLIFACLLLVSLVTVQVFFLFFLSLMFYDCPMALRSEYGSEKKMAEGGNEAELLKEKANNYFKGRFSRPVKSASFNSCLQRT